MTPATDKPVPAEKERPDEMNPAVLTSFKVGVMKTINETGAAGVMASDEGQP